MTVTVVVPTYRRPDDLRRALRAIAGQRRTADEVLVVIRPDDVESSTVVEHAGLSTVRSVLVEQPGVIAAMNAGLAAAASSVIALTDDDAAPWPDWLERIERHFAGDLKLGVIGGKDWQYKGSPLRLDDGRQKRAGEMQWHGRVIGQHHWALAGPPKEVTVVKGVNCAFHAAALRQSGEFDTRLAGSGAQVHWELSICLALKRAGWRVVFDPALGVDHFPAERFDEDQRGRVVSTAVANAVHNETLILCEHFGLFRRMVFLTWAILIGTRGAPGIVQVPRLIAIAERGVLRRWWATMCGRCAGTRAYVCGRWSRRRSQAKRSRAAFGTLPAETEELNPRSGLRKDGAVRERLKTAIH